MLSIEQIVLRFIGNETRHALVHLMMMFVLKLVKYLR